MTILHSLFDYWHVTFFLLRKFTIGCIQQGSSLGLGTRLHTDCVQGPEGHIAAGYCLHRTVSLRSHISTGALWMPRGTLSRLSLSPPSSSMKKAEKKTHYMTMFYDKILYCSLDVLLCMAGWKIECSIIQDLLNEQLCSEVHDISHLKYHINNYFIDWTTWKYFF